MFFDTIVAPITGNQPAAVAVVRMSGPEAWEIAGKLFKPWPDKPESHRAVYGSVAACDDGLALPFSEGHGYTGEECVEFSVHGSLASVRALVDACVAHGARMAEPGEFTQRAFLNGKLDLTQAEGVRDTVAAATDAQLRQANLHREGVLRRQVSAMRSDLLSLLAKVEASVDFSEEIGELDRNGAMRALEAASHEIDALLQTAPAGRILRQGFRVAIVGPPNAGKSSLLNSLLGSDRSIVTENAGTTRDYVEEQLEIGGVKCVLFDTAGLRESSDRAESIGIQKAIALAAAADEIWYVYDIGVGWTAEDEATIRSFARPVLVLANKTDLLCEVRAAPESLSSHFPISALTRKGFEALIGRIASKVEGAETQAFINSRHEGPLCEALRSLTNCIESLKNDMPDDLLSVGLRNAAMELGEITGETATENIVDRIFHDFCIGK